MSKKHSELIKLSEKLLKLAPSMAKGDAASWGFWGEPKLPKKLKTK